MYFLDMLRSKLLPISLSFENCLLYSRPEFDNCNIANRTNKSHNLISTSIYDYIIMIYLYTVAIMSKYIIILFTVCGQNYN